MGSLLFIVVNKLSYFRTLSDRFFFPRHSGEKKQHDLQNLQEKSGQKMIQ